MLGIPLVSVGAFLIFNLDNRLFISGEDSSKIFMSLLTTIAIWLGVRKIVIVLWERYPWDKHPVKHLIYEVILVFLYTMLVGLVTYILFVYTALVPAEEDFPMVMSIAITLLITYFITCIHEAWFFYSQWNISLLRAKTLEKENLQSQYETLRSQINPHFLFNTLNTLTSLIEEDPKKAVTYLGYTADFLRRLLNVKDQEVILLEEELTLVETFYTLQQERYGENFSLVIDIPQSFRKRSIPPLALQMLVENAIKHNVIARDRPLAIEVSISDDQFLCVKNNLQRKDSVYDSSKIGLENIRSRYSFLTDKKMTISQSDYIFEVRIPLLRK